MIARRSLLAAAAAMAGCAPRLAKLREPALVTRRSPEVWKARLETTQGVFTVQVVRPWAPLGADRFYAKGSDTTDWRFHPNRQTALPLWRFLPVFTHYWVRMPRNQRSVMPGQAYHVTQRGTNRQKVFFTDSDRSTYPRLMAQNLEDAGVRVLGDLR